MYKTITTKDLRLNLKKIGDKVQKGEAYTVIYRSKPLFNITPLNDDEVEKEERFLKALEAIRGSSQADDVGDPSQDKKVYEKPDYSL